MSLFPFLRSRDWRWFIQERKGFVLIFILFIYGWFSNPTPETIKVPEIIIGLSIILLIGFKGIFSVITCRFNEFGWLWGIFVYFLFVPSIIGIFMRGNNLRDYLRDFIPFLYLFLPFFLLRKIQEKPVPWAVFSIVGLFVAGIGIIIRLYREPTFYSAFSMRIRFISQNADNPWQDPAALFTLMYTSIIFIYYFMSTKFFKSLFWGALFVVLLIPYLLVANRAGVGFSVISIGLAILSVFFMDRKSLGKNKLIKTAVVLFMLFVLVRYFYSQQAYVLDFINLLTYKTSKTGLFNSRLKELSLLQEFFQLAPPINVLFGWGWGAKIYNPIYGTYVRYVHNAPLYFLLKTGVLGLLGFLVYMGWIALKMWQHGTRLIRKGHFLTPAVLAFWPPFITSVFLEPMYKVLSFGLLCSLAIAMSFIPSRN